MREIGVVGAVFMSLLIALLGVFAGYLYKRFLSDDSGRKIIIISFSIPLLIFVATLFLMNTSVIGALMHDYWEVFSGVISIVAFAALAVGVATLIRGVIKLFGRPR